MSIARTNGFRWLPSYYEAIRDLPDAERLQMYDAIADFGFGNSVEELPPLLNGYFGLIKPSLEKSMKFEAKQKDNGEKGGRPPKPNNNPEETQNSFGFLKEGDAPKPNDNLAVAVDSAVDSAINLDIERKGVGKPPRATRFTPPTVEEVTAYCRERQNSVDAQRFVDFYTSKGWKVGKENMRDWKAAVRTWEHRDKGTDISSPDRYYYSEEDSL